VTEELYTTLIENIKSYHPSPDLAVVEKAYHFASHHHRTQVRSSGEPYVNHVLAVAILVTKLKLDLPSVVAAILHDTIEDCEIVYKDIEKQFGDEVADIVEGVTKLARVEFDSREEKQAESFRKMLLAMAQDIRVILVKLCDRLHNMRTLHFVSEEKRRRVATETLEIYAPIANRLGIYWLKSELEDLCLQALRPSVYQLIKDSLAKSKKERDEYVKSTCNELVEALEESGISAKVQGRSKHFYSISQKMEERNLAFEEVHDLHGFRVLVPSIRACYETLGVIHSKWKPVPGRFKDYIAMPKPNMYQSLHTTLIGPGGQRIEVQIRTPDMHRVAEEGIAAHWRYKEGASDSENSDNSSFDLKWVTELVESQQYLKNPDEFIQSVKGELFPEDVFVFTPKGDLIRLAHGSTPVDFAYAVHTDIGHRTTGAKVNGSFVSIDHTLDNGDTVEVVTSKNQVPSKDWLSFVASSKAKQRIRTFLKSQEHSRSMAIGMELLSKDLRKVKRSLKKLEKEGQIRNVAESFGLKSEGELYAQLGHGRLTTSKVLAKLLPEEDNVEERIRDTETPMERIFQRAVQASRDKVGVKVSGLDDILVRFARCCDPLPGDRISGYVTRGRGVTVHRADCPQVHRNDPLRKLEVEWDTETSSTRRVHLNVHSQDTIGLLANVTMAITKAGANINSAHVKTSDNGKAVNAFEITIQSASHLEEIRRAIEGVPGVIRVERVKTSRR
jgi:GTP pyrophosphokinase